MYVHVGEDVMVRTDEIIAILDQNSVQASEDIKQFLQKKSKPFIIWRKNRLNPLSLLVKRSIFPPSLQRR